MINIDAKDGKYLISCAYSHNWFPDGMPSRRWDPRRKVWVAPVVRLNTEYIKNCTVPGLVLTDAVKALIATCGTSNRKKDATLPKYTFKTQPFDHQRKALEKLWPLTAVAVFADVGTGKTKMFIDLASMHYQEGLINKVLVVALVSIKRNWREEIKIHSPYNCDIHLLDTDKSGQKKYREWLKLPGFKWLVVGIESLSAGAAYDLASEFVDDKTYMVIDESSKIKTHNAKRSERCRDLGSDAYARAIMTGTPITQGMVDLYSQFQFLDKDIIGINDFFSFRNRYAIMGGYENKQIIGYRKTDELIGAVSPYIFQVRKRDVLKDLPERTTQIRRVKLSEEQKKHYGEIKNKLRTEVEGKGHIEVKNALGAMLRLAEICGGFISYENTEADPVTGKIKKFKRERLKSNPKLEELMNFLEELPEDEPAVIWATFVPEMDMIYERICQKYGEDSVVQIRGQVDEVTRHEYVTAFQRGEKRFIVGNQGAGGIGLNMTAASLMIYFSNDFSLEKRIQSEGRIERIGQTRKMTYVDIVCEGTVDEHAATVLIDKGDFAEYVRRAIDDNTLLNLV